MNWWFIIIPGVWSLSLGLSFFLGRATERERKRPRPIVHFYELPAYQWMNFTIEG